MLFAPAIARETLVGVLDVLVDGNIHAHRHILEHRLMDNIPPAKGGLSREASDFSDAIMDICYLLEKLQGGKNLGEVIRGTASIITKNAVLRMGAAELLDTDTPIEHISTPEDEAHAKLLERAVLNQVIMLLDIYEASLKDKDITQLKSMRAGLKKELDAIRRRAGNGDEKARAMLGDAQTALDNAKLSPGERRYNYGSEAAINFLRNRVYARILHSSSTDVLESGIGNETDKPSAPGVSAAD